MPLAIVIVERLSLLSVVHTLAKRGPESCAGRRSRRTVAFAIFPTLYTIHTRSQHHFAVMQDRNVVVLCNLKPRNMRGVKSNGMVSSGAGY